MARAEEFEKAWRLAYTKTDYSLLESFLYPDYEMYVHRIGMKVDFETEKSLIETLSPFLTMGPWKILYENEVVLCCEAVLQIQREVATILGNHRDSKFPGLKDDLC